MPPSQRPTVVMEARPLVAPPEELHGRGLCLDVSAVRVDPEHPLAGHKSLNYVPFLWARAGARLHGADEALLLDARGQVVEAAASNAFCVRRGTVLTPPISSGALPGVTRQAVLEVCQSASIPHAERPITLGELAEADEVFLTNSLIEIVPVRAVGEHDLDEPVPGPLTCRLQGLYRELVERETAGS